MHTAKMQAAAKIIKDEALNYLATKHGLTVDQVILSLAAGNERAIQQFGQLVKAGMESALRLHDEGKISLL